MHFDLTKNDEVSKLPLRQFKEAYQVSSETERNLFVNDSPEICSLDITNISSTPPPQTIDHMVKRVKKYNLKNTSTFKIFNVKIGEVDDETSAKPCKKGKLFSEPSNQGIINDIVSTYLETVPNAKSPEVSDLLDQILMND